MGALFASSAMNGAIYEATNVFFKLKYEKTYDAVLATPMTSGDVALGEMLYGSGGRVSEIVALDLRELRPFLGAG